ncbi:MAG: bifunctional folylpolyglutamate synthase/dihydrofolate synthase [Myxococcales bacterium]|nr:bifunctional folylpolyglutamate synthase/dihydrofolate synthase [Myxococcales bacterium]
MAGHEDPDYKAALEQLYGLTRFGEKLDLTGPRRLEQALGHPLASYRSVLIGGTNGKGSTAAFLEAILRHAGLRVGLFTSPHLVSFCERIRVDGADVAQSVVAQVVPAVMDAAETWGIQPSFFEAAWATAALTFKVAEVDVAIWEVGLGGRLDATNVCEPVASAIASIGLDHTHVLGDTLEAIAREKAAIFRPGRPNLTAAWGDGLAALAKATPLEFGVVAPQPGMPPLPLPGLHQQRNAALAMALAGAIGVMPDERALQKVRWPGRAERFPGNVFLDCAHNGPAAEALAEWLQQGNVRPLHLIMGAMADKDVASVVAPLAPLADSVTVVTPAYPRRMTAETLASAFEGYSVEVTVGDTVAQALRDRPRDKFCVVTGSCFLVGEARAALTGKRFPELGLVTTAR